MQHKGFKENGELCYSQSIKTETESVLIMQSYQKITFAHLVVENSTSKKGMIKASHFAHKPGSICADSWNHGMSHGRINSHLTHRKLLKI